MIKFIIKSKKATFTDSANVPIKLLIYAKYLQNYWAFSLLEFVFYLFLMYAFVLMS